MRLCPYHTNGWDFGLHRWHPPGRLGGFAERCLSISCGPDIVGLLLAFRANGHRVALGQIPIYWDYWERVNLPEI